MLERDMEDLIAKHPDDFFPGRGFELLGRQRSFTGVGRFDLLFKDRFETRILMELKAVSAKYEVATQLAKYKDELKTRGENDVLMWLVAPQIPNSVREFLDRIGIEYSEIHLAEFGRVADRHGAGVPLRAPKAIEMEKDKPSSQRVAQRTRRGQSRWLITSRVRDFVGDLIPKLSGEQQVWVARERLIEELSQEAWITERLDLVGLVALEERRNRIGNWVDWFSANYDQGKYDLKEKFERDTVNGVWAYRPRQML
jgi:hypothetical protein